MLREKTGTEIKSSSIRRRQIPATALLVLVLLLGFAVRVFAIERMPPFVHWDEVNHAEQAQKVLSGEVPLLGLGYHGHPAIAYFQFAPYLLWGGTLWSLRITAALWSMLALSAAFFAVRQMFGQRVALYATLLMAVAHLVIHFSRVGLNNIQSMPTSFLAIGLYLKAQQTGSRRPLLMLLAGAAIGFNLYQYYAARTLFFGAAALWLCSIPRRKALWRSYAQDTLLLALGFLIVAGPLLWWYVQHPDDLTGRANMLNIFGESATEINERMYGKVDNPALLIYQTVRSLAGFMVISDTSPNYHFDAPLLDPVTAVLMLPGIILAWYRNRKVTTTLLVWALSGLIAGVILIVEPPGSTHYILLVPLAIVFAAICLDELARSFVHRAIRSIMFTILAAVVVLNLSLYFIHYPTNGAYISLDTDVGHFVREQRGCCTIWYLGNPPATPKAITAFIAAPTQVHYVQDIEQLELMLKRLPADGWPSIIIVPNEQAAEIMPRLTQLYPGGKDYIYTDRRHDMFHAYTITQPP